MNLFDSVTFYVLCEGQYSPPTKIIFIFIYSIYKLCQDNLKKQQNPERESEEKLEEEGDYSVNKSDVNPLVNQIVRKVGSAIGGIGGGFWSTHTGRICW